MPLRPLHAMLFLPLAALAQSALEPVLISATPLEQRRWLAPASVDVVDASTLRAGQLQVNLSEGLGQVPGLVVLERQNYAQDLQVSVRGFGARSTFGVRGLRLYVDGIPASAPDGQGQAANFPLGSAQRVEAVRGPYAALYGSSSGGVISLYTEDGSSPAQWRVGLAGGSAGVWRASSQASGAVGTWGYMLDVSTFGTEGQRAQSAAQRGSANLKLSHSDADGRLVLLVNTQHSAAQDPLGLSRAEFNAHADQTTPSATLFDTRKSLQQGQFGLAWEQRLADGQRLELMGYAGQRAITQYQAIPTSTQAAASSPGGVIDLARNYYGWNARWRLERDTGGGRLSASVGLAADRQDEARLGYDNFTGPAANPSALGLQGRLRRDERNTATTLDPYAQLEWTRQDWTLSAGVRRSLVRFDSADHYLAPGNGDDSGSSRYSGVMPVLGLRHQLAPGLQLFASTGQGLETPTLNEVAYQANGASGLNTALLASRSHSSEAGLRGQGEVLGWTATLFDTRTTDEIVVLGNSGGRASYRNAGRTLRQGLEWSGQAQWPTLQLRSALTLMRATYEDAFSTCAAAPCTSPNLLVSAGNRMPGIPNRQLALQAAWQPEPLGAVWTAEVKHTGAMAVNDSNSDEAAAHTVLNLAARWQQDQGAWQWREFVRVDNATNLRYAGSVIVNEGNGRYFETAARRTLLLGLEWSRRFP